jgi:hypothetical protein
MLRMTVQQWINLHPLSLLLLIPTYIALVMWVISRAGGWARLAQRFTAVEPFAGESWGWQSARFRGWCSYNHCLVVGANQDGLYLSVMPILMPLRFFHPALMIPWGEIEVETGKMLFGMYDTAQFRIGREERVTVKIYGKLVKRVRQGAGSGWPLYNIEKMQEQTMQ